MDSRWVVEEFEGKVDKYVSMLDKIQDEELRILKCHIQVEQELLKIMKILMHETNDWIDDALVNLKFSLVFKLISGLLGWVGKGINLYEPCRLINDMRNCIAHENDDKKLDKKKKEFLNWFKIDGKNGAHLSKDQYVEGVSELTYALGYFYMKVLSARIVCQGTIKNGILGWYTPVVQRLRHELGDDKLNEIMNLNQYMIDQ